ncbi:MAG: leucine efflux protein LeuE [Nocardioides sp.]|uniref:leucine efflux protein LeuE n=1 Tax=Nocardioides sp. TaxID=35761 RepID=UPI0039E414D3
MLGVTDLRTYLIGTIVVILLPGPNSLYVLSVAARAGVRRAYRAAAGVWVGDTVIMTLSACGVASLIEANPVVFDVVKYAGAGYLAWLAIGMVRASIGLWRGRRTVAAVADGEVEVSPAALERPFRRALLISLLNPKAILFFVAFFVQFVDPGYDKPWLSFVLLGTIAQVCSITYLTVLIFGGDRLAAAFRRRRRLSAAATSGVGAIFLGFAVKLSLASVH